MAPQSGDNFHSGTVPADNDDGDKGSNGNSNNGDDGDGNDGSDGVLSSLLPHFGLTAHQRRRRQRQW